MKYISTRGQSPAVSFGAALTQGLAPDGGLYVPESWPKLSLSAFDGAESLADVANVFLKPFVEGDALAAQIPEITREAFNFPAPRVPAGSDGRLSVLELFHGPTAAFKDFGARFLAACLARMQANGAPAQTVIVATSGDTGAAVAAAFHRRPGFRVVILYPDGRVSPRQAHQLGCFGDNVHAFHVAGSFDDCQDLARRVLGDESLKRMLAATSANSISLGRLLPQITYYAHAA